MGRHTPSVLVTVGTDHHPFDRLVDWIDRWPARSMADVVVQYGTSHPIPGATCEQLIPPTVLEELVQMADAVVTAAGPGTVMLARRLGHRPIVVPRRRPAGEHVDDHQLAFARHLDEQGIATVVESFDGLALQLDRLFIDATAHRIEPERRRPPGIGRVGSLVDALVRAPR
jgi:UDP-N-acetylglucosamine transferase subunit ALG13